LAAVSVTLKASVAWSDVRECALLFAESVALNAREAWSLVREWAELAAVRENFAATVTLSDVNE